MTPVKNPRPVRAARDLVIKDERVSDMVRGTVEFLTDVKLRRLV
ncbi:MAG TPA: hypothetical protein VFP81_05265 [Propionibacteriaceae bacterium]|nr:hypothetical protein [Propionibacteriaceae bacterium]